MDRWANVYEKIIALFVFVVFAYFALGAQQVYEFYSNPVFLDYLRSRNTFWELVSYVIVAQKSIFLSIIIVSPLCILLSGDEGPSIDIGKFAILGWPVLGYLLGRRFDNNDTTYMIFLAYCATAVYVLVIQVIELFLLIGHKFRSHMER